MFVRVLVAFAASARLLADYRPARKANALNFNGKQR